MRIVSRGFALVSLICLLTASTASAQVQTGSIAGVVSDASSAVLPGVTVSVSGEKLIGGVQTQVTDTTGSYRFDRLPPGMYRLKFELQGFRIVEHADIIVNAAFVASVNAKLDVGSVSETITVSGESPTVDTKSNLQQTVMNQDVLEGIPSGRDPWSVAKIIPGVQVGTYDVGGTQSYQQSNLSSHGSSTDDVSYNIDGATVNWPGGGGGATMLYYDQGMFEEVNYMTSAIPAEVMVGGVSINMVTKDAGNRWRGDARYNYSSGCLTPSEPTPGCLESDNIQSVVAQFPTFLGNPTKRTYDFNIAGGGAVVRDRLWVNGSVRRWLVDKLVSARNLDRTQAIDDNTLKNYSGKAVFSLEQNQKLSFSYNWDNKIRGHRRDTAEFQPDIASVVQTNPASSTQVKYTGIRKRLVYESSFSLMKGQTNYLYQPGTPASAVRRRDTTANTADGAALRHEEQPNSRTQFDNTVSYTTSGLGGDHLIKGGLQFARLYFDDFFDVQNNMYLVYNNGRPIQIQAYNTPTDAINIDRVIGFFVQDAWTVAGHLTINLGARFDHNVGVLPAQSVPDRQFASASSISEQTPIKQNIGVWRTGVVYDPVGDGLMALKASYSRYGLQVGINRVLNVNPFQNDNQICTWTDPNGDGVAQANEISQCAGFTGLTSHYGSGNGPNWPYSDEVTAGVERQVMRGMRVAVMYYHRTNRNQIGVRNLAVPTSAYTPITVNVPNGPNGATTATVYNLSPAFFGAAFQNNVVDNQPYLDTTYDGIELTANKRFSNRWQMVAGLTIGQNKGGVNTSAVGSGQSATVTTSGGDLNDPNFNGVANGIVGNDSKYAFRLSGSYRTPGDVLVAGSLVANQGYPFVSTFQVTRALVPTLTRASQIVWLSPRGDERLPNVTSIDLALSRPFKFGQGRQVVPRLDIYNIGNADTVLGTTGAVGGSYGFPTQILAPRIMRVGFSVNF